MTYNIYIYNDKTGEFLYLILKDIRTLHIDIHFKRVLDSISCK